MPDMPENKPARRMRLVPDAELRDLATLAAAAVKMHTYQTHYGKCDVCDLVKRYDEIARRLDVNVTGLRPRKDK